MDNISYQDFFVIKSSDSNFQIQLNIDKDRHYTHAAVSSCCIPKTYYVLPRDAVLTVNHPGGAGDVLITYPKGNSSVLSFPLIFTSLVNSAPGISPFIYSVSFPSSATGTQTGKFTFSVQNNAGVQPTFRTNDYYLARIMGLTVSTTYAFSENSLTSPNVVNFQSYDELLILSDRVKNNANLLQEIYASGGMYNSSILWSNASLPLNAKLLKPNNTNLFKFTLVDGFDTEVDLNGSEWSFVLKLFRTSNYEDTMKKYIEYSLLDQQRKSLE